MMRAIARISVQRPICARIGILFALLGRAFGHAKVGKLKDLIFTLKSAPVITPCPGATAAEGAIAASGPLKTKIQQMGEVDHIVSRHAPGLPVIQVEIADKFDGGDMPQLWDDLRDHFGNARPLMPAGALRPSVNDAFSDVYGIYCAVFAPGYAGSESSEIASFRGQEVQAVDGVSNAQVIGLPEGAIFVDLDDQIVGSLGVPPRAILDAVAGPTAIVPTGTADQPGRSRVIDAPRGDDTAADLAGISLGVDGEIVDPADLAEFSRSRVEDPSLSCAMTASRGSPWASRARRAATSSTRGPQWRRGWARSPRDFPWARRSRRSRSITAWWTRPRASSCAR